MRLRQTIVGFALTCGALLAMPYGARPDNIVLKNGQRLNVTGYQLIGDTYRLQMAGVSVDVPFDQIAAIEPEDQFAPPPPPPIVAAKANFRDLVENSAARYSVDADLISSVIATESNFNARAVSRKNARGLMQLMPETAARLGVRNVFDPQENIDAGTRYLGNLLQRYRNDLALALAAYNAGPERVEQYGRVPPVRRNRILRAQSSAHLPKQQIRAVRKARSIAGSGDFCRNLYRNSNRSIHRQFPADECYRRASAALIGMDNQIKQIFTRLRETCDFAETDFSDVNACTGDGDNGLHYVVRWGDLSAAKALIGAGIDINKAGDRGYTPLHVACMQGNVEMVKLLLGGGADIFALSEGDTLFATARLGGHDEICDLLNPLMKQAQALDPTTWVRARIAQLRREITYLEKKLSR